MNYEKMNLSPSGFLFTIRELGYSVEESIADLVDNSISKNANNITFRVYASSNNSVKYISIMDDGDGMSENELTHRAMQWGPEFDKIRKKNDLGRFGFGLKAASLAHCEVLTVITKKNGTISHRKVDADHIFETDKLETSKELTSDMNEHISRLDNLESGTIVIWEKLDRLLDSQTLSVRSAHLPIVNIRKRTEKHLAMIFSEMMDNINIHINTVINDINKIEPWDPFLKDHKETEIFPETKIDYKGSMVSIKPYILPSKQTLMNESKSLYKEAGGVTGDWKDRQGFYIYRKNRLIVPGDWLEIGNTPLQKAEKYNRLRIKINYDGEFDEDWKINLMKNRIRVPLLIKNKLNAIFKNLENELRKMNYSKKPIINKEGELTPWTFIDNYGSKSIKIDRNNPNIKNIINEKNKDTVEKTLKLLEKKFPIEDIFYSTTSSDENNNFDSKQLQETIKIALEMKNTGMDNDDIITRVLNLNRIKVLNNE